jgi:hypothetical protein
MSKYRARLCPNCDYFVGFAVAQQRASASQLPITNFCLNCNYKLPVYSIVRGVRSPNKQTRRGKLRLVQGVAPSSSAGRLAPAPSMGMDTGIGPQDYARHLRVIGQDLENIQLDTFNLECAGDAYLVWVRSDGGHEGGHPLLGAGKGRLLQKLWRNRIPSHTVAREESYTDSHAQTGKRLRYSVADLDRMERGQRTHRRQQSGAADGHSLSQLLRTVGDLVGRKGERLLGISWQALSISMVVETPQGRKEIDVFRPDNLYDLWVKMYLRRDNRALSDTPR